MNIRRLQMPMTAAALSILLAACGGSSGGANEKAVSSSPAATTTASTTDASTPTGTATGATTEASASIATTTNQPISEQGISGKTLRAMLDVRLNYGNPVMTPFARAADKRYGWYANNHDGTPSITTSQQLNDPSNYTDISSQTERYPRYQYAPLNGSSTYGLSSRVQFRGGANSSSTVLYRSLGLNVGIQADTNQLTLDRTMKLSTGPTYANNKFDTDPINDETTESLTLTADNDYTIAANGLIPFGQVLQTWKGADNQKVELVLVGRCDIVETDSSGNPKAGSTPQPGAELCWNVDVNRVKRQICNMWKVPDDKYDASALLQEVADDRSVYAGESGTRYWRQENARCQGKG